MKSLEHVLAELRTVERAEVLAWVEANWVRPASKEGGMRFDPVDVARIHLIRELRHDLAVDDEAMPVVLSLLDEMYALRRRLGALARALVRHGRGEVDGRRFAGGVLAGVWAGRAGRIG